MTLECRQKRFRVGQSANNGLKRIALVQPTRKRLRWVVLCDCNVKCLRVQLCVRVCECVLGIKVQMGDEVAEHLFMRRAVPRLSGPSGPSSMVKHP
jgi:hypothetical protein